MRVDDLARDVGISKRTLYEQFRTKEDMAREALLRRFERLREYVEELRVANVDEAQRLRGIVEALSRVHGDARSTLTQDIEATPVLNQLLVASRTHGYESIEAVLSQGIARGRFRAELDVRMARCTLLAAVEGLMSSPHLAAAGAGVDEAIAAVFNVLIEGLVASRAELSRTG